MQSNPQSVKAIANTSGKPAAKTEVVSTNAGAGAEAGKTENSRTRGEKINQSQQGHNNRPVLVGKTLLDPKKCTIKACKDGHHWG